MSASRLIRRYSAYFHHWAQAFGNHEKLGEEGSALRWLIGEHQIGLILTPEIKRLLYPFFLGRQAEDMPRVQLSHDHLRIDDLHIRFDETHQRAIDAAIALLEVGGDLHLCQTYHLIYPGGTRILTLGRRAPLPLIYREITSLSLELVAHGAPPGAGVDAG